MNTDYIDEVFGPNGHLAQRSAGYRPRDGQVRLARAIDKAIAENAHILGEGPCGVGKSRAYCVPAIFNAAKHGRRVVIATANIALQEQLMTKDLPELARALPWAFSYRLLKGRNNYLCVNRHAEANDMGLTADELEAFAMVDAWGKETDRGDVSELPVIPSQSVWSRFSVKSDECTRKECKSFRECHFEKAKSEALEADIIVTNYHVLFASIMLENLTGERHLLPAFDVVIMDEAHEAADVAREFFGYSVSEFAFRRIKKAAMRLGMSAATKQIAAASDRFWFEVRELAEVDDVKGRLRGKVNIDTGPLHAAVAPVVARLRNNPDGEYATETLRRIDEWITQSNSKRVYWLEPSERGHPSLRARYVDVGDVLARDLFGKAKSVVACSATLSVGGSFDFVRRELGAPASTREIEVPSPFDFRRQAKLVVPRELPEPRDPAFPRVVAESLERVIADCNGRTLGLFTSHRNMNAAYEYLRPRLGNRYRLLRQGDAPRSTLTKIFAEDVHSVLLATESFWAGVDIAGEALTAVVIDKLPFPSPDDPVVEVLSEKSSDAFGRYTIPKTTIMLKQGVGRLIRSATDVGVVVILDVRLVKKGYGARILRALPDMPLGTTLADVGAFMRTKEQAA